MALSSERRLAAPLDDAGLIAGDLACVGCGYNLRTQPADGRCPECARPCAESLSGFWLRSASPEWLETVANGFGFLSAAGFGLWALVFVLIAAGMASGPACAVVGFFLCVACGALGVFLATASEPEARQSPRRVFTLLARGALPLWFLPFLVVIVVESLERAGLDYDRTLEFVLEATMLLGAASYVVAIAVVLLRSADLMRRIPRQRLRWWARSLAYASAGAGGLLICVGLATTLYLLLAQPWPPAAVAVAPASGPASMTTAASAPVFFAPRRPAWMNVTDVLLGLSRPVIALCMLALPVVTLLISLALRRVTAEARAAPTMNGLPLS